MQYFLNPNRKLTRKFRVLCKARKYSVRLGSSKTRSSIRKRHAPRLHLNDIVFSLNNVLSDRFVLSNGMKLNSLLDVNYIIILSQSKVVLQNCLNILSLYCNFWMLKTNPKKTKMQRRCDSRFYIYNEKIDIAKTTPT